MIFLNIMAALAAMIAVRQLLTTLLLDIIFLISFIMYIRQMLSLIKAVYISTHSGGLHLPFYKDIFCSFS